MKSEVTTGLAASKLPRGACHSDRRECKADLREESCGVRRFLAALEMTPSDVRYAAQSRQASNGAQIAIRTPATIIVRLEMTPSSVLRR